MPRSILSGVGLDNVVVKWIRFIPTCLSVAPTFKNQRFGYMVKMTQTTELPTVEGILMHSLQQVARVRFLHFL